MQAGRDVTSAHSRSSLRSWCRKILLVLSMKLPIILDTVIHRYLLPINIYTCFNFLLLKKYLIIQFEHSYLSLFEFPPKIIFHEVLNDSLYKWNFKESISRNLWELQKILSFAVICRVIYRAEVWLIWHLMKNVKWSTELVEMFDISVRSIKLGIIKSACTHNFVPSFHSCLWISLWNLKCLPAI